MIVLNKIYSGEEICDIDRDVSEMFNEDYDPTVAQIPKDEHGFHKGSFKVTVEWIPE